MTDNKETVLTLTSSSAPTFNIDYLKKNLQLIDVSVPSYETDFMDHTVPPS